MTVTKLVNNAASLWESSSPAPLCSRLIQILTEIVKDQIVPSPCKYFFVGDLKGIFSNHF
jgi:hypothetical protein